MRRLTYGFVSVVSAMTIGAFLAASTALKYDPSRAPAEVWAADKKDVSALAQRPPDSLEGNAEAIALGKRTFHTYCWGCHGRNGTGAQCPDFSDNEQIHGDGYEDLVKVVTNGVKGTPMGPWGYALGRERLLQVVAYVFSLKGTRQARQK